MKNKPLQICNATIQPGEQVTLALPTPELYTCAPMHIPIHVIHGKKEGPCLLVCAALHGDEVNGIAIIQKLLNYVQKKKIAGTLIAVPVVNIYGLMSQQRYLPDRRDLERNFPGSETGSYAARYAHFFNEQIFSKATHCIDLHTGEQHFQKYPHVITNFKRDEMLDLARVFRAPLMIDSETNFGFLWQMDEKEGIPTLIYQTGEALRLDSVGISLGLRGITKVMQHLGMIQSVTKESPHKPFMVDKTHWIRSPGSGLCRLFKKLGSKVKVDDEIASISDPFGTAQKFLVRSPYNGVVIEQNTLPLTNEGEPLVRIAVPRNLP